MDDSDWPSLPNGGLRREEGRLLEPEITKGIDEALETLRWCRHHLQEHKASETLRLLQVRLGYLALALSWETDGEVAKAEAALALARGRTRREGVFDHPHALGDEGWNLDH